MATKKSFTDLEQSRKLAEILPLESADMYYSHEFVNSAGDYHKINIAPEGYFDDEELLGSAIPAWSLAALLSALPEPKLIRTPEEKWTLISWDKSKFPWNIGNYINPVDACVDMILKLRELKIL